jgi:hypothetical protein
MICLLLVLPIGVYVIWQHTVADMPLIIHIPPPPPTPNPNARDYYLRAQQQLAATAMPEDGPGHHIEQPWDALAPEKITVAQQAQAFAATTGVLTTLHAGFAYPYLAPARRSLKQFELSEYSKERDLARYLRFAAKEYTERGDWGEAVACHLDAVRLGSDIPQHAVLIGDLVGIAVQSLGRAEIWDTIEHLNGMQARAATARMQHIVDHQTSFADTLQEEE